MFVKKKGMRNKPASEKQLLWGVGDAKISTIYLYSKLAQKSLV
jgi:hypothetical protein